ncbi:MAG: hypothetical protein NT062_20515 [Proteobacteria bacterium]|nr:hypothetical protein [Pseudomonadota bacterium]
MLKSFYAMILDGKVDPAIYADATFDEYYALQRVFYPGVTRQTAAKNAHFDHHRAGAAPPVAPEPTPPARQIKAIYLARRPMLDLGDAAVPEDVQSLVLDRIQDLQGFRFLPRLKVLEILTVALCKSEDRVPASPPVALDRVEVRECSPVCVETVLRSTAARVVSFNSAAPVSLALLDGHPSLRELTAGAPLLRGIERLSGRPLESLTLASVDVNAQLRAVLATLAPTLRVLSLTATRPFGPEMLPDLAAFPELRRVAIFSTDFAEYREAWLSYAVAHPQIDFVFGRIVPSGEQIEVVEIHRGVDVLRIEKGKKVVFEVSGDLASEGGADDNGDLEDRLREPAKAAKKKVKWSSEADTFVAQTPDLETARWIIDQILDTKAGGEPKKAAAAKKSAAKKASKS